MGVKVIYIFGMLFILNGCKIVATTLIKVVNFRNRAFEITDKYCVKFYHIIRDALKEMSFVIVIVAVSYNSYERNMYLMENGSWKHFEEYCIMANIFYLIVVSSSLYLAALVIGMLSMRVAYVTKELIIVFGPWEGAVSKDKVKSCVLMHGDRGEFIFQVTYGKIMKNTFVVSGEDKWIIREILMKEYNAVEE